MSKPLVVLAVLALVTTRADAWEVKLSFDTVAGPDGLRPVTIGVPLLAGQAKDPSDLRLAMKDGDGQWIPVPAQFRVLARWWRGDNSIRWALVDFAAQVQDKKVQPVYLTNAAIANPRPTAALSVDQTDDALTVTTGPARFVLSRKRFNFVDKAFVDSDADGRFDDAENLLAMTPDLGLVLEDTFGQKYYAADGAKSVEVVESGPLRVCIRAVGRNLPRDGKGYSPGMYGYDIFLNFYAGRTDLYVDLILTNNPAKSIGIPAFEDGSLVLKLAGGASGYNGYRLLGEKPCDGKLAPGESACLYQDSNGAATWATCPGFGKMETSGWRKLSDQLTSFRGYKVWKRTAGKEEELAAGDHARGVLHAWNGRGGVVVHTRNFWQQFPKAAEVAADGTVRLGLWPREWKWPHMLQDCSAKGHEILLHFYAEPRVHSRWLPPDPQQVADSWDSRLMPRPPIEHIAACGALADLGPYTPPTKGLDKKPDTRTVANGPRMLTDDKLYGNAYGWRIFGERWRSNGGHGTLGARQPIDEDNYLYRWYVTGVPEWLAAGDARSRQYRDVRRYRIDDQDALGFKNWAEFRVANVSERDEWTNRPRPNTEESKKYQQGLPGYSSGWAFPNPEHCVLDLLYDRYLIFGDVRSLENMRVAAGHGGFFAMASPHIGRDSGWSWRTLERYWELTGDKRAEELLKEVIKVNETFIGKEALWSGNDRNAHASDWFTQIWSRAVAMTALHTGDAKALGICKSLAEGKEEKDGKTFSALFAVLYHLTGDEKYKQAVLGGGTGEGLLNVGGYFPACDHWLLQQPAKPPAK